MFQSPVACISDVLWLKGRFVFTFTINYEVLFHSPTSQFYGSAKHQCFPRNY